MVRFDTVTAIIMTKGRVVQGGDTHPDTGEDTVAAPSAPSIWEPEAFTDGVAPAVLLPEHFDNTPGEVVFVLCQPIQHGAAQAEVHLRYTDTDQLALLVYSSLDELVRAFGDKQTWISVPVDTLADLVVRTGADVIVYDTALTEGETPR